VSDRVIINFHDHALVLSDNRSRMERICSAGPAKSTVAQIGWGSVRARVDVQPGPVVTGRVALQEIESVQCCPAVRSSAPKRLAPSPKKGMVPLRW